MKLLMSWINKNMDKNYYSEKQQKLQQKLAKTKDQFLVDSLNLSQRLGNEIQEIQAENQEINKIMEETNKKGKIK